MGTVIRSELSKRNPYYISKHRYYELKHYCLQWHEWQREYASLALKTPHTGALIKMDVKSYACDDKTAYMGSKMAVLSNRMDLITDLIHQCGDGIEPWLSMAIKDGKSYPVLQSYGIPCGKDYFYRCYRKFFWLLDEFRV